MFKKLRFQMIANKSRQLDAKSTYDRKLEIIQTNVYGVDLDPFAVNIARLRLWLSLSVDYEGATPEPLPNLDYKVEIGDSLLGPNPSGGVEMGFRKTLIDDFLKFKTEYLTAHHARKVELRKRIERLKEDIASFKDSGQTHGFDWAMEFAEVFATGGFDIAIANPPYVRMELFKEIKPVLRKNFQNVHAERSDLYCYFYSRAVEILQRHGMLAFISSNKWFKADYGSKLRQFIVENAGIMSITDFGDLPVFHPATTYPMIFVARKSDQTKTPTFTLVESLEHPYPDVRQIVRVSGKTLPSTAFNGAEWTLADPKVADRIRQMESSGPSLAKYINKQIFRGLISGLNEAFIIDETTRRELLREDKTCARLIKPFAVGKDIRRWIIRPSRKWVLYVSGGQSSKISPAILKHLRPYREKLEQRANTQNWFELQQPQERYVPVFEGPKIVYQEIATYQDFAVDEVGTYVNGKVFMLPGRDLFLLAILNSAPAWEYLNHVCAKLVGGALAMQAVYLSKLPVPTAVPEDKASLAQLAMKCIANPDDPKCQAWQAEIDKIAYRLYSLEPLSSFQGINRNRPILANGTAGSQSGE